MAIALTGCLIGCESAPDDGDIDAGTYRVTSYAEPFEITVPDGWSTADGDVVSKDDPGHAGEGAVEVVVGDYSGFEFDHSIEGDVDITACDRGRFCIHSEFSNECTRWYSTQEERETSRVSYNPALHARGRFLPVRSIARQFQEYFAVG